MMSNLSTSNKKWILGGILCLGVLFLLGFGLDVFGDFLPLTTGEVFTYEQDGLFILKFTALTSFSVEWKEESGVCQQELIVGIAPFYSVALDFYENGWKIAELLEKRNIGFFAETGTCYLTENYTAGKTYTAYLVDYNNKFSAGDSIEIIKENNLRDKDKEPDIDEESIFILAELYNEIQYTSNFYLTFQPEIDITYPLDESEIIGTFEMEIDFWRAENYDRLMIIFEDWDIGSSCPLKSDPNYQAEKDVYFNNESLPYFSSFLATSSGITTIKIDNLEIGNYNCNRCHFVNETTVLISENICRGYRLDVLP